MKWIAFAAMIMLGVPLMTMAAVFLQRARVALFGLLVFSTVMKISVNFASMESYRGPDRGFEVHLTDLIAVSLLAYLLIRRLGGVKWWPFNTTCLVWFFGCAVISTVSAEEPLYSYFTLFKWAKSYLLYWVTYNFMRLEYPVEGLWYGVVGLAGMETFQVLRQKYQMGMYRPFGTFDHSNTIPCYLIMAAPLLLAWLLHGEKLSKTRVLISLVAVFGMAVCVVATVSRAGTALIGLALIVVLMRSLTQGLSRKKIGVALLFLVGLLAGVAKCADTFIARIKNAPKESAQARDEFNHAADLMAADRRFGVGLNNFSHVMTHTTDYRSHVEVMGAEEHAGVCHHIYKLTAAEMGYIGLAAFLAVLLRFYLRLFWHCFGKANLDRILVTGLFVGFSAVHLIGLLEWVFRLTPVMNMFLIMSAVGVVCCERLRDAAKLRKRQKKASAQPVQPTPALVPAGAV